MLQTSLVVISAENARRSSSHITPQVEREECIDCGACEPECPVEAIYPEDSLPDMWEPFVKITYAFPDPDLINQLVTEYATEHNVENTPPDA